MTNHATAEDFTRWEAKAKKMTIGQLIYAIKDCREAAEAMKYHNPVKSSKYMDECFTYADERTRREMACQINRKSGR